MTIGMQTSASQIADVSSWVDAYALPILIALVAGFVGGSLITYLVQRSDAKRIARKDGYSAAVAALYSWHEYPYRVRRRTSDGAATLDRLTELGHGAQERLERSLAWVATDDKKTYARFLVLVEDDKRAVGPWLKDAWLCPPITEAASMNLTDWGPNSIDSKVKDFLERLPRGLR